jgi:hypothetical protein
MIFHYTKVVKLPAILRMGLRLDPPYIQGSRVPLGPGEKRVVWFSTNTRWENTIFVIDAPSLAQAHIRMMQYGGLARIGCDESVAPFTWHELKVLAAIPLKMSAALYQSAIRVGARPGQWRGTLDNVTPTAFKSIDTYDGVLWVPVTEDRLERFRATPMITSKK